MALLEPFKVIPRNIRDWSRWFASLRVEADSVADGVVDEDALADNSVTLSKLADMATDSFIGRNDPGVGDPEILSAAEARTILDVLEIKTVTSTPHAAGNEDVILVDDDVANQVTINLPIVSTRTKPYEIKKLGSKADVIVDGNASETIDDGLTAILTSQYESITIVPDGSNWLIV